MAENNTTIVGSDGNIADVTDNAYLKVYAPTGIHAATLRGDAYAWNAVSGDRAATDCLLLIQNTAPDRLLVVNKIMMRGDIAGEMTVKSCAMAGLTAAGTAVLGINLNSSSANVAPVVAYSHETQSLGTDILFTWYQHLEVAAAGTTSPMAYLDLDDAVVVGYNKAIGIDTILEPAAGFEASIIGYFIDA